MVLYVKLLCKAQSAPKHDNSCYRHISKMTNVLELEIRVSIMMMNLQGVQVQQLVACCLGLKNQMYNMRCSSSA